jgi:hypothetical protein
MAPETTVQFQTTWVCDGVWVPAVGVEDTAFTVIVTLFEVAGLPVAHGALELTTQVMASEFTGVYI